MGRLGKSPPLPPHPRAVELARQRVVGAKGSARRRNRVILIYVRGPVGARPAMAIPIPMGNPILYPLCMRILNVMALKLRRLH